MSVGRRFELRRELGAGAFGTVYLADMISAGDFRTRVALKLLNDRWDPGSDAARRLRDEARLLGRLRHRYIVQVVDLVQLDGRWAVVMEHIPGADLERVLQIANEHQESVPPAAALEVAAAMAAALDAAFNGKLSGEEPLQVVHRDIKPSNVRLTSDGEIKVLDFGIARAAFEEREALTGEVRYGSLGYMSPERLLGEDDTPAGDVYAVGSVLYELLVGSPLGRSELAPDRHDAQVARAADAVRGVLGDAGQDVAQLIAASLSYDFDERPSAATMAERARTLSRAMPGEDLHTWARRFIPKVEAASDESREVSGTFTERGSNPPDNVTIDILSGPPTPTTRTLGGSATAVPVATDEVTAPVRSRTPQLIGAAVGLLVVVAAVALLAWWAGRQRTAPPEAATEIVPAAAPPAEVPPAEVPPVEAPPVEAAPAEAAPEAPAQPVATAAATTTTAPSTARATQRESTAAPTTPAATAATTTELLRAVKFTASNAESITATCGGVSGSGTTSALLRQVPVGPCSVRATIAGAAISGSVTVTQPGGFTCTETGGQLLCR